MEHDCPEQQLEFSRTVFSQPARGIGDRGRGAQNAFLLCPVDPGDRRFGEHVPRDRQTVGSQEWRSATTIPPNVVSKFSFMTIFGRVTFGGHKKPRKQRAYCLRFLPTPALAGVSPD